MEQVLYSLPDGWAWLNFDSLVENLDGKRVPIKTSERSKEKAIYPYYGATGIIDYVDDYIYEGEKLLISEDGANLVARKYPIAFLADGKYWVNNHAHVVDAYKDKISNKYLSYFFAVLDLSAFITGSAQPKLSQKKLNSIKIAVAPIAEQKRIVEKLDALLTRIDTAIEHLQQSVTLADALYASTINEQMMQAIELAGLSTVEKHIEQIQTGTTPPTKQPEFYENGDINWFAPSDFGDHDILFDSNKKLSQKAFDAGKARKFDAGTIMLVAIGATIGKIGYLEQDASSNQQITGMKFNSAIIPRYAYYWFRFIKPEILTNASTATLPIINQKGIKALSFCAPNKQLQETICRKIDEVSNFRNKVKAELNEKVELMRSLKASILDSAFKGEL
ncbi:restriction endonuclease subunit S [Vibrio cholerae]|nr:restriction endonuclease subunit S [Vibrio cholerae]